MSYKRLIFSPTIFGVSSDGSHRWRDIAWVWGSPCCGTSRLSGLLMTLRCLSKPHLHRQVSMEIGCPKTKVMMFKGNEASREPAGDCEGTLLKAVSIYGNHGLEFDKDHGVLWTCMSLVKRIWSAWASLLAQHGNYQCPSAIRLFLNLYQVCVALDLWMYGCGILGSITIISIHTQLVQCSIFV